MSKIITILSSLALAALAQAGEEKPMKQPVAPPTRIPAPAPMISVPDARPVAISAVPRAVRRAVVADAAKRFRVPESSVVLKQAEHVTWPDGALGCPEPGRMYTQALVAGFRIVAHTTDGELLYHTDTHGTVANCIPLSRAPTPQPAQDR